MIVKPTKKPLRYHAYCPYCKFTAFLSKAHKQLFIAKCDKINKHEFNEHNIGLFDIEKFDFGTTMCMFCLQDLKIKKCKKKGSRTFSIGCKDCSVRFFIPAEYIDIFYLI